MVRLIAFFVLTVVAAKAELTFWSPEGQDLTYVLPQGVSPQNYLQKVKNHHKLSIFVQSTIYSHRDQLRSIKTDSHGSDERALLVANSPADHSPSHQRVNNFGKHFSRTFVVPVGAALNLNRQDENSFYRELSLHFGLFIFMGGDDLDPSLYGQKKTWSINTKRFRDVLEVRLIRFIYFNSQRKILGVCRGLQNVFTALGGQLNQDVNYDLKTKEVHNKGGHHSILFSETQNSVLKNILTGLPQDTVDSHHHQSARENSVTGTIFQVSARSLDGVIESLESRDRQVLLVQFHPEMADNNVLFTQGFFQRLKAWQKNSLTSSCRQILSK